MEYGSPYLFAEAEPECVVRHFGSRLLISSFELSSRYLRRAFQTTTVAHPKSHRIERPRQNPFAQIQKTPLSQQ